MSTKYMTNIVLALAGGFLVVATQAFSTNAVSWLALAVGIFAAAIAIAAQLDRSRGLDQRLLDVATVVLGAVTVVFSRVFDGSTMVWLSFAEALGFVGLGVVGMTLHEIDEWRAEHHLAQLPGFSRPEQPQRAVQAA
jgi:hypothetical protein